MLGINASYRLVRESIVAFTLEYHAVKDESEPLPVFPHILGTGFAVRPDGIIATNAHIVDAIQKAPRPPDAPEDESPIHARLFHLTKAGMLEIPLEVLGVAGIEGFYSGDPYYGPKEGPDLGFVHVKAKGLSTVNLDSTTRLEEGVEVATAGFPMGTDALSAPGWMHQFTPTLQRGIISAVHPFPCLTPHGYSINIMTQGGASGSPVFLSETGSVIGILYAGLRDVEVSLKQTDSYHVPINISYVVPAHYLIRALKELDKQPGIELPLDTLTVDEMISNYRVVNTHEEDRMRTAHKKDSK